MMWYSLFNQNLYGNMINFSIKVWTFGGRRDLGSNRYPPNQGKMGSLCYLVSLWSKHLQQIIIFLFCNVHKNWYWINRLYVFTSMDNFLRQDARNFDMRYYAYIHTVCIRYALWCQLIQRDNEKGSYVNNNQTHIFYIYIYLNMG